MRARSVLGVHMMCARSVLFALLLAIVAWCSRGAQSIGRTKKDVGTPSRGASSHRARESFSAGSVQERKESYQPKRLAMAGNNRGVFSSLNDDDDSSPATRQLYVQAPPSDLVGLSALAGADVLVTLLVLFAAEKWHGSQAWKHQ
eukprot:14152-Heterococcus_DN1.PRE.1